MVVVVNVFGADHPHRAYFFANRMKVLMHDGIGNWLAAIGRNNWLFAGSLRAGQRVAAVMGLIQSARMNGHDLYAYLKDVLTRLPTQRASQVADRLPHRWQPLRNHHD